MKVFTGASLVLLLSSGLFAQGKGGGFSGAPPRTTGSFGSVVFPGGTPATSPGTQRSFGSVTFPGGGGPRLVVPGTRNLTLGPRYGLGLYGAQFGSGISWFYYYAPEVSPEPQSVPAPAPSAQAYSNVTLMYPPQGAQTAPVVQEEAGRWRSYPPAETPAPASEPAATELPNYRLAFKDHKFYSAVAYWVDGNTIHYITSGNQHNQAPLDLLDRKLTDRLSKQAGDEVRLP